MDLSSIVLAVVVGIVIGVIATVVISKIFKNVCGVIVVDTGNPDKDVFRLEVTNWQRFSTKGYIVMKVVYDDSHN